MDDFHWSDLANECPQSRHILVVSELANEYFERGHIKECDSNFISVLLERQDVLRLIGLFPSLECTLGDHVADVALDALVRFGALLFCSALFFLPDFELARSLRLLDHRYFEPVLSQHRQVLVEYFLGEANVQLFGSTHPVEVEQLLADDCVTEENLVKLSQLEEENLLKIVHLKAPVLRHRRGEVFPAGLWD